MAKVWPVMDAERRGVRDQNVQIATMAQPIPQQTGGHLQHLGSHLPFRVLETGILVVAHAPFEPGDEHPLLVYHATVHIAALR